MFTDIEKKLKVLAQVNFVCGIILAILCPILGNEAALEVGLIIGLIVGLMWLLMGLISSWFIYGFAELLENTKKIDYTLKIGFANEICKNVEQKRQAEQRQAEQKEKFLQEQAEAKRQAEQLRKEAEAAKNARINTYWEQHSDERKALLEKRAAAESKLKEVGGLAREQRKALQNLIQSIDAEFAKDREV